MPFISIQTEIDILRDRLKQETAAYKQAIADHKSFAEVKTLYLAVKATLKEIEKAIKHYEQEIEKLKSP